jgi:hypothetical protein
MSKSLPSGVLGSTPEASDGLSLKPPASPHDEAFVHTDGLARHVPALSEARKPITFAPPSGRSTCAGG